MTPMFRIVADGADITTLLNVRLLLLGTTDKPGMESDDYELRIDDRDSAVSLPSRGATIEIFLGYLSAALLLTADQITNVLAVIGVVPSFNLRLDPAILLIGHRNGFTHSSHNSTLSLILNSENNIILLMLFYAAEMSGQIKFPKLNRP